MAAIRQLSRHGGSTYNIERSQKYSGSGNLDLGFGNCSGDVRANSRNKLPSLTEQLGAKCLHCWYDDGMAGIPVVVVDEEENEWHQKKAELSWTSPTCIHSTSLLPLLVLVLCLLAKLRKTEFSHEP